MGFRKIETPEQFNALYNEFILSRDFEKIDSIIAAISSMEHYNMNNLGAKEIESIVYRSLFMCEKDLIDDPSVTFEENLESIVSHNYGLVLDVIEYDTFSKIDADGYIYSALVFFRDVIEQVSEQGPGYTHKFTDDEFSKLIRNLYRITMMICMMYKIHNSSEKLPNIIVPEAVFYPEMTKLSNIEHEDDSEIGVIYKITLGAIASMILDRIKDDIAYYYINDTNMIALNATSLNLMTRQEKLQGCKLNIESMTVINNSNVNNICREKAKRLVELTRDASMVDTFYDFNTTEVRNIIEVTRYEVLNATYEKFKTDIEPEEHWEFFPDKLKKTHNTAIKVWDKTLEFSTYPKMMSDCMDNLFLMEEYLDIIDRISTPKRPLKEDQIDIERMDEVIDLMDEDFLDSFLN